MRDPAELLDTIVEWWDLNKGWMSFLAGAALAWLLL